MNPKNSAIAHIVVIGQVALAFVCVSSLCLTLFYKNYSDPVVLTCLVTLTGTLVGNLGSLLGGPRTMNPQGTKDNPVQTESTIKNTPENPVPTTERP